jgi:hypothetical protein
MNRRSGVNAYQEPRSMQITLRPEQERAVQRAIQAGLIRSVDELIDAAIEALPHSPAGFDKDKARLAGGRIREIHKGVRRDR